ncbi:MAG: serine/threonine protein kinase [Verrucomicrobiales bacterium]|nr:serine/threonine protein kinase [Verrucomicrobiales bacterium]
MANHSIDPEAIFSAASEIADAEEMEQYLAEACAGDPALRDRVERLLNAASRSERLFPNDQLGVVPGPAHEPEIEGPGKMIGPYKLLEQIGEGGFGVVFMAEQQQPVRRRVALKIIKLGMDTRQVIARFEAERQALALMQHPNLAKVLDAGATPEGRPYFVMELVPGTPITEFCEKEHLTLEQRLRLFIPVCQAIQHAHQKGVIHRDIKPGNVLVTLQDGASTPVVIDFGVAKAMGQRLTDKTLFTRFSQMIGTPAYMSPEQAELSRSDVDTRSDVYALGILLYELMTGSTPIPEKELLSKGYGEMERMIRELEPERPSTRVTRTGAKRPGVDVRTGQLRGDLDWIVLKAIEKDPRRRYQTPQELAADLQRHLDGEPVIARPPTLSYTLSKFVRRHRVGVSTATLVLAALLVGLIGIVRANIHAQVEAANAMATLDFIEEGLLGRLDPFATHAGDEEWGRNLTLLEAVRTAAADLEVRFAGQPLVEASLRLTLGRTYLRLNEAESAGPHLERAVELFTQELGPHDARTLEARHYHAEFLSNTSRSAEAIPAHEAVLEARRNLLSPDARETFESRNALAWALFNAHATNYPRAEALFRQTIADGGAALGDGDPCVLRAREGVAEIRYQMGEFGVSARLGGEILAAREKVLGPDHPDFLRSAAVRANDLRYRMGDFHAAEELGNEVLEKCRRVLGQDHPTTMLMESERGKRLGDRGLWAQAVRSRRELVQTARRRYGNENPTTLWTEDGLGGTLRAVGNLAEAEQIHRASLAVRDRLGQTQTIAHQRTGRYLAWTVFQTGRVEEAQSLYETVVEQMQQAHGGVNPVVVFNAMRVVAFMGKQASWPRIAQRHLDLAPNDAPNLRPGFPMGFLPLPGGVLAAQLARDAPALDRLLEMLMIRHAGDTNLMVARQVAMVGLALRPEALSEIQQAEIWRASSRVAAASPDPLEVALVLGMIACRNGASEEAIRQLTPLEKNPDHVVASTAGFVCALARFGQGREGEARQALGQAAESLEVGLRPGLLGHRGQADFDCDLRWADYARVLVLRDETEDLVLGRIVSEPVNQETLKARRTAWQPTQERLVQAHQCGRDRNWAAAARGFAEAMDQGPINWEQEGNLIPSLHLKAASVFALTGDTNHFATLCRELVEPAALSQPHFTRIALLWPAGQIRNPESEDRREIRASQRSTFQGAGGRGTRSASPIPPPRLSGSAAVPILSRAIEAARWHAEQIDPDEGHLIQHEWTWVWLGIAEYRAGLLPAALEALAKARNAFNLAAAGTAHAFSALASQANGQSAAAAVLLAEAESHLQQLLDGNPDRLSQHWQEVAILELALREAQASLRPSAEGISDP